MPVRTAYAGAAVAGEVLSAANVNRLPGGWIGYAEVTASQGGITTEADITGLSVAVTVGANRRIRVSYAGSVASSVANDTGSVNIKEGATYLSGKYLSIPGNFNYGLTVSVILTPAAGTHTYKIVSARAAGSTGIHQHTASAAEPSFLLVEDLGPSA